MESISKKFMKKMLLVLYDDENAVKELLQFLKENNRIEMVKDFHVTNCLQYGSIQIDPKCRTVKRDEDNIELTNYEFDVLYLLASHPNQVFSKEQIYEQVWNMPYLGTEDNVVSLIHRIRKKVEPNPVKPVYILTVWGIGYKFNGVLAR